jgi:hypothetical protein
MCRYRQYDGPTIRDTDSRTPRWRIGYAGNKPGINPRAATHDRYQIDSTYAVGIDHTPRVRDYGDQRARKYI